MATSRGRCRDHARERDTDLHSAPRRRSPAARKVYASKRWRILRRRVLTEQPICSTEGCDRLATEVDHVDPIEEGGKPFARANLQGLCSPCHGRKTRQEVGTREF